jgi:hypothetical protein
VFTGGRRLQGRTFIGPVGADALTSGGQITGGAITICNGAFEDLYTGTGARLCVYSRPVEASTGPPAVDARDGLYGDVVTAVTRSVPGTLRSRKT